MAVGAEMLVLGGLATDIESATERLVRARSDGSAAECFQSMVTALGGPANLVENPAAHLQSAATTKQVVPGRDGYVQSVDTRAVGLAVVTLGGGRRRVEDDIDHSVGLSEIAGIGEYVDHDHPLAVVHARNDSEAENASKEVIAAYSIGEQPPAHTDPVIAGRIAG
jgi:thymidine phosphorylase